jgi:hypothetical protein
MSFKFHNEDIIFYFGYQVRSYFASLFENPWSSLIFYFGYQVRSYLASLSENLCSSLEEVAWDSFMQRKGKAGQ